MCVGIDLTADPKTSRHTTEIVTELYPPGPMPSYRLTSVHEAGHQLLNCKPLLRHAVAQEMFILRSFCSDVLF